MIVAAICLGVCQIVGFAAFSWLLRMYFERKQRDIERRIDAVVQDWLVPAKEGEPSKANVLVQRVGAEIGTSMARSVRAALMAESSHVARVANGAADALSEQQQPSLLGLLAGGKRGKGAAVESLLGMIGPMLAGRNQGNSDNGSSSRTLSVRERLQRGG